MTAAPPVHIFMGAILGGDNWALVVVWGNVIFSHFLLIVCRNAYIFIAYLIKLDKYVHPYILKRGMCVFKLCLSKNIIKSKY